MKKYTFVLSVFVLLGFSFGIANAMSTDNPFAVNCTIKNTLRLGSRGDEVSCLQIFLNLNQDGKFGKGTRSAVIAWQKLKGLKADGVFGAKSRNILFSATPVATSSTDSSTTTYTSSKYGFSIDYPTGAQISDVDMSGGRNISFNFPQGIFMVEVVTQAWNNGVLKSPANCNDFSPGVVTSHTNINGVDFLKGDVSSDFSGMNSASSATEYCVLKNEIAYKLIPKIIGTKGASVDVNNSAVLNKMLSSFKFTVAN